MATISTLHRLACEDFAAHVAAVRPEQWSDPTPCDEWTVRDLVNHVVGEDLWTAPLMGGATIEEVGDRFDGDVLGDDPATAAAVTSAEAVAAVSEPDAVDRIVHLSFGDTPGTEYAWQLFADHLIHGWDLARATGQHDRLDPDLVAACADWFASVEDLYRQAGAVGPRPEIDEGADAQTQLLATFGRSTDWTPVHGVIARFNAAFGRGDLDAIMALMTEDCLFEDTTPPDGIRHTGQGEVRAAWEKVFANTVDPSFEVTDVRVSGDRAVQHVTYRWGGADDPGHVRGVDLLRVRDGLVAEKRSYVKG
jgi:uncharacterized protein (TIGR03086 family)